MRNFQQPGDSLTVVASRTCGSGEGQLVGLMFGMTKAPAVAGAAVEVHRVGVINPVPKAAGQVWAQGVLIYWDNTAFNFTTTVGANRLVGMTAASALLGAVVGSVLLDGTAR